MALLLNDMGRPVPPTDYSLIPEYTLQSLMDYKEGRVYYEMGSFMEALLQGHYKMAIMYADENNLIGFIAVVSWCYNNMPSNAWGSPAVVQEWKRLAHQAHVRASEDPEEGPKVYPVEQREDTVEGEESDELSRDIVEELGWTIEEDEEQ